MKAAAVGNSNFRHCAALPGHVAALKMQGHIFALNCLDRWTCAWLGGDGLYALNLAGRAVNLKCTATYQDIKWPGQVQFPLPGESEYIMWQAI